MLALDSASTGSPYPIADPGQAIKRTGARLVASHAAERRLQVTGNASPIWPSNPRSSFDADVGTHYAVFQRNLSVNTLALMRGAAAANDGTFERYHPAFQ